MILLNFFRSRPHLRYLALAIGLGVASGWLFTALGVPLSWIIGPLISTGAISICFGAPLVGNIQRWSGQSVIGAAVGLNLTPEAVSTMLVYLVPMLISAVATIVLSLTMATMIIRLKDADMATAVFATLPGGPIEMAALSQHYGGNAGVVAFSQTTRVAVTVILIPPILILGGMDMAEMGARSQVIIPQGLLLCAIVALAGGLIAKRIGIINPFFLGSLVAVGLATMSGAPLSAIPVSLIAAGQVAIGVALGAMFDRRTVLAAISFVLPGLIVSLVLLALAFALAAGLIVFFDDSFALFVLANAPGGTPEMSVTAVAMDLDASIVAAFHVVRMVIVMSLAPFIFRIYRSMAAKIAAGD